MKSQLGETDGVFCGTNRFIGREICGKMAEDLKEGEERNMEDEKKLLQQYQKMHRAVRERYMDTETKLEKMKEQGKTKTATYRQYMGNKMMYRNMLDLYKLYDLEEREAE